MAKTYSGDWAKLISRNQWKKLCRMHWGSASSGECQACREGYREIVPREPITKGEIAAKGEVHVVKNPYIIVYEGPNGDSITELYVPEDWDEGHYGLMICDIVRHVAIAFKVPEAAVWEWVERERKHPTTTMKFESYEGG